jgi:hypothetical protein
VSDRIGELLEFPRLALQLRVELCHVPSPA